MAFALTTLPYPVLVGNDLQAQIAAFVAEAAHPKIIVVCDERVLEHAQTVARALPGKPRPIAFRLGEKRKRLRTVELVLAAIRDAGADRRTLLIGVGGGVAGDLFGFVAATYMRGIAFINVATSLVAMVDASIGGKTGVDLAAGKNLAGAFRDPAAVFAPIETLATLPLKQLREGLGEVVKHAMIAGEKSFARLEELASTPLRTWPWDEIIAESMQIKAEIVSNDRLEAGRREVLNLGHTFAHGLEYASDYRLTHGAAVAIGLRAAGLLGQSVGTFTALEHARLLNLLTQLGLPLFDADVVVRDVLSGMAADKKAQAGNLRFVIPQRIGEVIHGISAPRELTRAIVTKLRKAPPQAEYSPLGRGL